MIGKKIGQYLKANGIKQSFLAEKTGIPAYTISDICKGERRNVSVIEYYKICEALGVDMNTFIER